MAQATSIDTRSSFITKLLAPITTSADTAAGRRLIREMRDDMERVWSIVLHRYHAAHAYQTYCSHTRRAAEIERRRFDIPEAELDAQARLMMIAAVDCIMDVPAPTIGALRQKEKLRGFNGGRDWWEAAIAADHKRLLEKR